MRASSIVSGIIIGLSAILSASLVSRSAWATTTYFPTSLELLYQPTYTMATGGPTSQWGIAGGGLRIGYAMTSQIAFELGGYYNGYVFGDIGGVNQTVYAPRATADFVLMLSNMMRVYAGVDANAYLSLPSGLTSTQNRDIGIIGGLRFLIGSSPWCVLGAEYRYATAAALTYSGGSIKTSAIIGTIGIQLGGIL